MAKDLIILGITISKLTKKQVLDKINQFLSGHEQHYLVTPNAEIILRAIGYDEELFYILNQADIAIADGIALKFAAWVLGKNLKRYTGADLVKDTLAQVEKQNIKIAVLNWDQGLSKANDITTALKDQYPKLKFFVDDISRCSTYNFDKINQFAPDILYVTLGSPWQEKFVYHNLQNIPSVKIGMGIGGSFDYLTAKLARAPKIMRLIGIEWLWRFVLQPWRWKRIYQAIIIFPLKFLEYHFINRFFYRKNVVGLIVNDNKEILLVNWHRQTDYWGLPQGGIKHGESERQAIFREMKEEVNLDKFEILGEYKDIYRYKWPKNFTNQGYKGQKQTLFILKLNIRDEERIKLNYWEHKAWKWVKVGHLIKEADLVHQKAYLIFLEKFKEVVSNGK